MSALHLQMLITVELLLLLSYLSFAVDNSKEELTKSHLKFSYLQHSSWEMIR